MAKLTGRLLKKERKRGNEALKEEGGENKEREKKTVGREDTLQVLLHTAAKNMKIGKKGLANSGVCYCCWEVQ